MASDYPYLRQRLADEEAYTTHARHDSAATIKASVSFSLAGVFACDELRGWYKCVKGLTSGYAGRGWKDELSTSARADEGERLAGFLSVGGEVAEWR